MSEREQQKFYLPIRAPEIWKLGELDIEETWSWDQSRQLPCFEVERTGGPQKGSDELTIAQLGLEARSPNWPSRALSIILLHQRAGLLQQHRETHRCHLRLPVHVGPCPGGAFVAGCTPWLWAPQHPYSGPPGALVSPPHGVSSEEGSWGPSPSLSLLWLLYLPACSPALAHFFSHLVYMWPSVTPIMGKA